MSRKYISDEQILQAYADSGNSAVKAAAALGIGERTLHKRLARIEEKAGPIRFGKGTKHKLSVNITRTTRPNPIEIDDGVVMVASDCHYWPGEVSTGHRAFVKLAKKLKPEIVVINGDEFDGASISRHGRIGWEQRPTVAQEIEEVQRRLEEIRKACPDAHHLATYGNHTMRYDTYLSSHASALEGVHCGKYEDHIPGWTYAWAWMVNEHTLIKHRLKGGIHATWNNTADAQISTVTGHMHNLRVTPRSTMSPVNNGTIYGVDTGMLADPWGPQFAYIEQGPRNWRSGFAVLTFVDGVLMPPEFAQVVDEGKVFFRGQIVEV
jgi:hypothetical protein